MKQLLLLPANIITTNNIIFDVQVFKVKKLARNTIFAKNSISNGELYPFWSSQKKRGHQV